MKELLKFLKPYTKESILGPLFKLTEATFELFVPLVIAGIVSNGIEKNDNTYILKMGGLLVLLALIGLTCALTAQFFAAKAATGFAASLREAIFENIQSRTYSELEEHGTGALITRITSDVNQLQTGVNLFLRLFLRSPFIVFGAVIMAFTVNVKGALVFVVCVPILFLVVFAVLLKSIPLYKKVQSSLETVTVKTRENITGIRVIRAFNCDDEESEAFDKEIDTLKSLQLFAGRVTAIMNPATILIVNVATLAVLYVGAREVNTGIIERGALIALLNYMAQILVELIKLANLIITMTKSVACGDRIANLLKEKNIKEETSEIPDEKKFEKIDSVEFDGVGFKYPGASKESLKDISFSAKKGEIIGIIGGTGSGKTTLINLICGYYGDYSGVIKVNDENLSGYSETVLIKALRGAIGIVPQTAVLFSGTVEDNLKWGKKDATKEDMDKSLKRAEAYDFVYGKKGELQAEVTEGGKNFSG
ncbi:MAG: ATP-binding cassette domain-containing protein, partial [Lachnospiraceae bacterium]|nr:ATP-binding cassette domain-containing protein [Lachnospiraceae bacterium]